MMNDSAVRATYKPRCYDRVNMSSSELLDHLQSSSGPTAYSYASNLDVFSDVFVAQTLPLTPFMVLPPGYNPREEHLHRQTLLWLSAPGTVTPGLHCVVCWLFERISAL